MTLRGDTLELKVQDFHALRNEIAEAGLPPLFELPCVECWADEPDYNPDSVEIDDSNPECRSVDFTDEAWARLRVYRWTELPESMELIPTKYRFTLRCDDVETEYFVLLESLTEKRVTLQGSLRDIFVCEATYEIERV